MLVIFSCFTRRSFQNVHQPWWTVHNDFYPVATELTSNLLSLAWRLRLHPIVGLNDPKPDPIYASQRLAFLPKCILSACKCIAQYRLKFQIIHCQFSFWIRPCNECIIPLIIHRIHTKVDTVNSSVSIPTHLRVEYRNLNGSDHSVGRKSLFAPNNVASLNFVLMTTMQNALQTLTDLVPPRRVSVRISYFCERLHQTVPPSRYDEKYSSSE